MLGRKSYKLIVPLKRRKTDTIAMHDIANISAQKVSENGMIKSPQEFQRQKHFYVLEGRGKAYEADIADEAVEASDDEQLPEQKDLEDENNDTDGNVSDSTPELPGTSSENLVSETNPITIKAKTKSVKHVFNFN